MFRAHYGKCIDCGQASRLIVVKRGCCGSCNERSKRIRKGNRLDISESASDHSEPDDGLQHSSVDYKAKKYVFQPGKRKSPIKVHKKVTGEWKVFMEIWGERRHKCQCCGESLQEEAQPIYFSHILSKGAYPSYRLNKLNIMLKCPACHHEWEFGNKSQDKFKLARMIADKLKRMYYGATNDTKGDDTTAGEGLSSEQL